MSRSFFDVNYVCKCNYRSCYFLVFVSREIIVRDDVWWVVVSILCHLHKCKKTLAMHHVVSKSICRQAVSLSFLCFWKTRDCAVWRSLFLNAGVVQKRYFLFRLSEKIKQCFRQNEAVLGLQCCDLFEPIFCDKKGYHVSNTPVGGHVEFSQFVNKWHILQLGI